MNYELPIAYIALNTISQWYRDNVEFFRYIPSEEPHTTVFIVPGMELVETSTPTNIVLNNVGSQTGGLFKCEVSEGPPRLYIYS